MTSSMINGVPFKSAKSKYPQMLREFGDYISSNCKHGAELAMEIVGEDQTTYLCCLQCSLDYIMKIKAQGKITIRKGTVTNKKAN